MAWKDWSAVKKGALIGGLVGLLPLIVSLIFGVTCSGEGCMGVFLPLFAYPSTFLLSTLAHQSQSIEATLFNLPVIMIIGLLVYVGIGALIGFIVQKVKVKKSEA